MDNVTGQEEAIDLVAKSLRLSTPGELILGHNHTLEELKDKDVIGKEGYVVKWENGVRVKIILPSTLMRMCRS